MDYLKKIEKTALFMRRKILDISYQSSHAAHLGGGLSMVESDRFANRDWDTCEEIPEWFTAVTSIVIIQQSPRAWGLLVKIVFLWLGDHTN